MTSQNKSARWALFRYTDEHGNTIRETWAETFVQGHEQLDQETEQAIGKIMAPKIFSEVIKRQEHKPTTP
jgi:hypothetical protein